MSISGLYNKTATVSDKQTTTGSRGQVETTEEVIYTDVPCMLSVVNTGERDEHGRIVTRKVRKMYCSAEYNIQQDFRVTIDGTNYEVVAVDNPAERDHHLEVELEIEQ